MKTDNTELFEHTPVSKAVITLIIPTVISQIITVIYNMADTFFIGQMNDPNQVAAATLAMPPFVMLTGIANLFGIGGGQPDFAESWNRRQGKSQKMCCFQHMERRCCFLFVWHYHVSDTSGYLPAAWHGREYIWLLFQLCTMDDYDWRDPHCAECVSGTPCPGRRVFKRSQFWCGVRRDFEYYF